MIRSKFALSKTIISQFIEKDKTANLKIELRYFNMTSKKSETIAEANIDLARAEKSGQFFHRILNKRGNTIGEVTLVPK